MEINREINKGRPRGRTSSQKYTTKMAKASQQYYRAKKLVLMKYRKHRFGVKKKIKFALKHDLDTFKFKRQHDRIQSSGAFSTSAQMEDLTLSHLVTSSLSHASVCSEFPISEMGSELSGNRGNGNSPFNSSNSCGSPESAVINTTYNGQRCQGSDTEKCNNTGQCDKCNSHSEPNNNVGADGECGCPTAGATPSREIEESIIDVVSVDEDKDGSAAEEENPASRDEINNASNAFDNTKECSNTRPALTVDIPVVEQHDSGVLSTTCRASLQSSSHSSMSPVSWQQQFMSFLSTTPEPSTADDKQFHLPSPNSKSPSSHSSRKKRSRKTRNSTCPCCIGSGSVSHSLHGKKQKHSRKHSLSKEHKHFIRDMVQLVSLRNKVVTLFCSIFPQCQELIRAMNPDSEKVDQLIDQVVDILQMPDPFEVESDGDDEEADVRSEASFSDSATDPLDLSEYPSLEKPDDVFFEDKDSDDMPILDDYSADDKSQDEQGSVSGDQKFLDEIVGCMNKSTVEVTKDGDGQMLDPGGHFDNKSIQPMDAPQMDASDVDLAGCGRTFSEGDSGILKDDDASVHSITDVEEYSKLPQHHEKGPCLDDESGNDTLDNSKCNIIDSKTEPLVPLKPNIFESNEDNYDKLPCDQEEKFQGTFQEFLNSSSNACDTSSDDGDQKRTVSYNEGKDRNISSSESTSSISHKPLHLPAYSDISEASRMSCSSPCDWMIGADTEHVVNADCTHDGTDSQFLYSDKDPLSSKGADRDCDMENVNRISSSPRTNLVEDLPVLCDMSETELSDGRTTTVQIYESCIETCGKPKLCLKVIKNRLRTLLTWLMPGAKLGSVYFKNSDNLEYLLDILIYCNTSQSEGDFQEDAFQG